MHLWKWLYAVFAIAVVVIAVIYSLPPPSNHVGLEVYVSSLTIDHIDEVLAGQSANTDYILNLYVTYSSSGGINLDPLNFNINTSIGSYQADMGGLPYAANNPLKNVSISIGDTVSGQIYISLPNGTTINSIYYDYNGTDYTAKVPSPTSWVSYVEGLNLTLNGHPVTTGGKLYVYSDTSMTGDLESENSLNINVYFGNLQQNRSVSINGISVNSPFKLNTISLSLPQSIDPGSGLALVVNVNAPAQSFYGYLNLNIVSN